MLTVPLKASNFLRLQVREADSSRRYCGAQPCQGWGRGFESLRARHFSTTPEQNWAPATPALRPIRSFPPLFGAALKRSFRRRTRELSGATLRGKAITSANSRRTSFTQKGTFCGVITRSRDDQNLQYQQQRAGQATNGRSFPVRFPETHCEKSAVALGAQRPRRPIGARGKIALALCSELGRVDEFDQAKAGGEADD
jgi:hypothetical protein